MLTSGMREPNATTDAGGFPRIYSSGKEVCMVCSINFAAPTMARQDVTYPLKETVSFDKRDA